VADFKILQNLNTELLRRLVIVVEMLSVVIAAGLYLQFRDVFFIYLPIVLVIHLLTIAALPSVFKKLNKEAQEDILHYSGVAEQEANLSKIDLWDLAVVGFYVISNGFLILSFLVVLIYNIKN
jgi:hypothetical protein